MTPTLPSGMRAGLVPALLTLLLLAAGCSSDPQSGRGPGGGPARAGRKPPTPMAGQEIFFDGRILAEVSVGTDGMPEPQSSGGNHGGGDRPHGRHGGGGGFGMQGGEGAVAGNISGNVPFGGGGGPPRDRDGAEGGGPRPMLGGGRPVMIHLRFTNQGPAPVELRIVDFVSPLGNFAVRPELLTLAPGQSLETDPMTSQLAGGLSEADVALVLRLGNESGKKTFRIRPLPAPPQEPNSPKS